MADLIRPRPGVSVRQFHRALHDEERLLATVLRLQQSGAIDAARAERLRGVLSHMTARSNYILRHLAVHLAIGASKVVLPLPVGAFLRGSWVAVARTTETVRRRPDRARVHSLPVFAISCVPLFGYLAYIVALRRHDPDAALLYANHIAILRWDQSLDEVLQNKPHAFRRIVHRAVGSGAPGEP